MAMKSYNKTLRISYKDRVTNEEARAKIQEAIGPHERPGYRKETQAAVVWMCLLLMRFVQRPLARHSEWEASRKRGGKTT